MKQRIILGGSAALVLVVALLNCKTVQAPRPAETNSVRLQSPPIPEGGPTPVAPPSQASEPPASASSDSMVGKTGSDALAERRGLTRPATTPALEAMKAFDRDEMLLLAQIQKRTGRSPPDGVKEIIDARRAGASFKELWNLADLKLAGQGDMLLAVRGWLMEVVKPTEKGLDVEPVLPGAKKGSSMDLGGSIKPVK